MTVEDLEIYRQVRTVLVRNWVNLQRLDFGCTGGTVYVRGRMRLLREPPSAGREETDSEGVTATFLLHLEREILRIPGVRLVTWDLNGWQRTGLGWQYQGRI